MGTSTTTPDLNEKAEGKIDVSSPSPDSHTVSELSDQEHGNEKSKKRFWRKSQVDKSVAAEKEASVEEKDKKPKDDLVPVSLTQLFR